MATKTIKLDPKKKAKAEKSMAKTKKIIESAGVVTTVTPPDDPPQRDSVMSIVGNVTTAQLEQALQVQTKQRKLIENFIKEHLREDRDYGKIHVVKTCQAEEKKRGSCDRDYHYSKAILFKPGQEKIFSLFGITAELSKDVETINMLEGTRGLVAYKCVMFQQGKIIGEGRGAATLASERSDPNSTIKKAEKRARMDAVLSLGFSEYFTQDLDDPDYASQREMANSKAAASAENRDKDEFGLMPRDPDSPIDNKERATLHRLILKAGFSEDDEILELLSVNGVSDPHTMTSSQARTMMGKIAHGMFSSPSRPDLTDPEPEAIPAAPPPPEPEIDVDDDFREEIQNRVETMGLTARGQMWLLQRAIGKPFAKWKSMEDKHWRSIYDILLAIEDGRLQVEDHYVVGVIPIAKTADDKINPAEQSSLLEEDHEDPNASIN